MAFHHVALACRDTRETHRFYTEAMGFELVKTNVGKTPAGGWAKHFFYETSGGRGLIAFWEIHDDAEVKPDWRSEMSQGCGLPQWANHLAFEARDEAEFEAARQRWLDHGYDVVEIDHGFCRSLYTNDPNGTMVEWCITTAEFTPADREEALRHLEDPSPPLEADPKIAFHRASEAG